MPITGAIVDLDDLDSIILAFDDLRESEGLIAEAKLLLAGAAAAKLDADNTRSVRVGRLAATINAPTREVIDGARLRADLADIARDGIISQAAVDHAIKVETKFTVAKRELSKLRALGNAEVSSVIDAATTREPQSRRLTIKAAA
jgi:hypothetical protein